jgi:hypothetical protein
MSDEESKLKKIWDLPDPPPHAEMTAGAIVKPDSIKPGDFLMIVCSAAVKLDIGPMGVPTIKRVDNDPAFGGVLSVRAYCYPFVACIVLTGKWKDTRMAIDVRRHKMVKVTQHFARCMMDPKLVLDLEKAKENPKPRWRNKRQGFTEADLPADWAVRPQRDNPHLKDILARAGWTVLQEGEEPPDDAQGRPPRYPDWFPPPDDRNDVEGPPDDLDEDREEDF